jgi:alpha-galactosidase/6-phospho-beta-glucosidase family protein
MNHPPSTIASAILLNYTNPMSILTWSVYSAFPKQQVVGLCHNVRNTANDLAAYLGVGENRLSYDCAGINHMTWFLRLEVDGEDAYPALRRAMANPEIFAKDRVRFEMMRQLGWFVFESSRHCSEYVPYFLRDDREILGYDLKVAGTLDVNARKIEQYKADRQRLLDGRGFEFERSVEYGSEIIHPVVTNESLSSMAMSKTSGSSRICLMAAVSKFPLSSTVTASGPARSGGCRRARRPLRAPYVRSGAHRPGGPRRGSRKRLPGCGPRQTRPRGDDLA